jgi:hypothetical protein
MDVKEIEWDGVDLVDLAEYGIKWQDLVQTVMNVWVP